MRMISNQGICVCAVVRYYEVKAAERITEMSSANGNSAGQRKLR